MSVSANSEQEELNREVTLSAVRYQRFLAFEIREDAEIKRWYSRRLRGFTRLFTGKAVQAIKVSWNKTKLESPLVRKIVSRQFRLFLQTLCPADATTYGEKDRQIETGSPTSL